MDGVEVIRGLRGWTAVPIVILSGRTDSADKVDALDAGADDYVDQAVRRWTSCWRGCARCAGAPRPTTCSRSSPSAAPPSTLPRGGSPPVTGDEAVDVRLTPTEWHLLEVLLRHPGKLISQAQLLSEVWGPGYETAGGNLRVYMAQAAPEARGRSRAAAPPAHRAGDGLPLRALSRWADFVRHHLTSACAARSPPDECALSPGRRRQRRRPGRRPLARSPAPGRPGRRRARRRTRWSRASTW